MQKYDYAAKLKYMICLLPSSCISQILWQGGWSVYKMWLCWLGVNVICIEWSVLSNLGWRRSLTSRSSVCGSIFSVNWLEPKIFSDTTTITSYHKAMQNKSQQSGNNWRFRSLWKSMALVLMSVCFSWLFHTEKNVSHSSLTKRKTMTYFSLFD